MRSSAWIAALAAGLMATDSAAAPVGHWTYREISDPITDARRGIAVLEGVGGSVVVKCDENGPDSIYIVVISDKYLGALRNGSRKVIMRIDDGQPWNETWFHDGRKAMIVDNQQATRIAASLAAARKVAMRLTSYDGEVADVLLESDGDSSVVEKAFATCGQAGVHFRREAASISPARGTGDTEAPARSLEARDPSTAPSTRCGMIRQPSGAMKRVPC